jgi:hypothetical protein
MDYLIKEEDLILQYDPGKGAWTYHLVIPNTANMKGKWGSLKVSGNIDGFSISSKNLSPRKKSDKLLAINDEIRKAINKTGGDKVKVTLYLDVIEKLADDDQIVLSFQDALVLDKFKSLAKTKQKSIIDDILSQPNEDKQVERILFYINKWA